MYIKLNYREVGKILQDHFDRLEMEILVEHVFCKEDPASGHLNEIDVLFCSKSKILEEASK